MHTPATSSLLNLASGIGNYKERHEGRLPESWDRLVASGSVSDTLIANLRKYCDIENRYQWLAPERQFEIGYRADRVVLLARFPGHEGDTQGPNGTVSGRFMIVETKQGDVQTRHYPDEALRRTLELKGRSLADYTETDPDPPSYFLLHRSEILTSIVVLLMAGTVGSIMTAFRRKKGTLDS